MAFMSKEASDAVDAAAMAKNAPPEAFQVFRELMREGLYVDAKRFMENAMAGYPSQPGPPPKLPAWGGIAGVDAAIPRKKPKPSLRERLLIRMGWDDEPPFHVHLVQDGYEAGGHVHVFVVKDGEAVYFKDESSMFPCDETVTKLRMMCS